MSKKTYYIILIIAAALLGVGGLIGYFIFSEEALPQPTGEVGFTVPGSTPQGKLKAVSEGPVVSARLSGDNILFYDFSGQLWQFNQDELKPVLLNEKPIENLTEIIRPKVSSPDSKKIVYQKNNALFTSDSSGKNQRTLISNLKLRDTLLFWPKTNQIGFVSKPSGLVAGGLWVLDTRNLNFSRLLEGLGLEVLYSPDGNSFIFSYMDKNGQNPKVASFDKKGESKIFDGVSTIVDKCVWSGDSLNIFCAAPKSWPEEMILPDDYYKVTNLTNDDIWKINAETGSKDLIVSDIGDINNILVDENENNIYFILRSNQFLYQLNLK